ncbi:MAG: hypothetical protein A2504_02120 [Bdellovibrionales bacterium RIFOXYD12_FULL_39_22]|nr:MAG: hypothetical protein A2385_12145 [Bdellovibrionales bacterium RIFOXYB1_FULL_39_21]OFZ41392.1 MAG: hypothetical protein A2485_01315 [Bdellovibrionales bacterium RIFOXYC12_FULL_39_17]OFZ45347.1 MAG: hypothetical protein A2404_13330 [Bdellovibrionales bacterium RIFOXYC1_FULL_39_130]OFZ68781.1 MAG: hypothetical protein A2451_04145 [Bdellovibrionales bacterium RIFOXYC2_FULL_39_8]OFZ74543.1 MAG: hypothetical protein A2560_12435 [Bdellovibrionales bacterium RIFOXYD1_FULL_39_84]OFZ92552.1 MAG:
MSHSNFQTIIAKFFDGYDLEKSLKQNSIYLCRNDGILLYTCTGKKMAPSLDDVSIGALLGGVWQAAEALASFIPTKAMSDRNPPVYRLSFDDSSQGVYILPITHQAQKYYLSLSYAQEINPGQLKANFRKLGEDLNKFLDKKKMANIVTDKKDNLLFNNITDEEMDSLFNFAGN